MFIIKFVLRIYSANSSALWQSSSNSVSLTTTESSNWATFLRSRLILFPFTVLPYDIRVRVLPGPTPTDPFSLLAENVNLLLFSPYEKFVDA